MTSKISLRLKLSDFINTEIESEIMEKIDKTHNDLNIAVLLYLWFEDGEIDTVDLKNPDVEFTYKCNSATEYLKQKNTDMASLNDEMKKMSITLGNLSTLLDNLRG